MPQLTALALPDGPGVRAALPDLARALSGERPAVPLAPAAPSPLEGAEVPPGTALVLSTSGSTGTPKPAVLPVAALAASATATHDRLGGPGRWLLALPAHHVAGVQVLARSLAADLEPHAVAPTRGAEAFVRAFTTAEQAMPGPRRYTSLVPTQLARLLRDADGTAALARFDGVLVGGAACPPGLVDAAAAAGARVVRTYGMSETSGGCVYDGVPLEGVRVRTEPGERGDAVLLGGPMLASGYLGMPQESARAFVDIDGQRWFRTGDLGTWDGTRLTVHGRADDLVVTGGYKVAPAVVEDAARGLPGVTDALAVGLPDAELGQVVGLLVVLETSTGGSDDLREALRPHLPRYALPAVVTAVGALPLRGPGKPDRRAAAALLEALPRC